MQQPDHISISISGKAYDILFVFTKRLNEKSSWHSKTSTVLEWVFEEEINVLFGDD